MSGYPENPPAFPFPYNDSGNFGSRPHTGMSLREYYIGQALANPTLCTGKAREWQLQAWFGDRGGIMPEEIAAKQAIVFADALLAARGDKL